jgi:hypothetical protein
VLGKTWESLGFQGFAPGTPYQRFMKKGAANMISKIGFNNRKVPEASRISCLVVFIFTLFFCFTTGAAAWAGESAGPQQIILTWTQDPDESQTITWLTPDYEASNIQYAEAAGFDGDFDEARQADAVGEQFAGSDDYRFTVTLTGLNPGTQYVYRVGKDGAWSEARSFTTAANPEEFSFLYLGDVQEGYSGWSSMVEEVYNENPHIRFALLGGDLTNDGSDYNEWKQFIDRATCVFSRIPMLPARGNHDGNLFLGFFSLPENGPQGVIGNCFYSFDYGDAHFVVLDTGSIITDMVKQWLQEDLQNTDKKWKFAVFHHPPYQNYDDNKTIDDALREHWVPILEQSQVDMVFVGHQHVYMRTYPILAGQIQSDGYGIVYVMGNSGSKHYALGQGFPYIARQETGSNCQIIDIDDDVLTLTARTDEGHVIDTFSISKGVPPSQGEDPISLWLSKDVASVGDIVTASGKTSPEAWVPIKVLDEAGNILLFDSSKADGEGNYSVDFIIPDNAAGTLTVVVGEGNTVASRTITVAGSITLFLDKTTAMAGDTVTASGQTSPEAWVPIKVLDEAGNILLFDSDKADEEGNYSIEFVMPDNAAGTLTVVVGEGSTVASRNITVVSEPIVEVTGVRISEDDQVLEAGQSIQLNAVVEPENATNKRVIWSSSDETVAAVDQNGLVVAVSEGEAVITVTTEDGNYTDTVTITVQVQHQVTIFEFAYTVPQEIIAGEIYPVPVTIQPNTVGDLGYARVRFNVEVAKPVGTTVQLLATDTYGIEYDVAQTGYWGPANGFPISADYSATTEFNAIFSHAGEYTITLSLVDMDNNGMVVVCDSIEITVAEGADTIAPELKSVSPEAGEITLAYGETFSLIVAAWDDNLYELEVGHSLEGILPEFSVYADEGNPYGDAGADFAEAGVTVVYNAQDQKWTIDFGEEVTRQIVDSGGIIFYLVIKDLSGNVWGSMSPPTAENTFVYQVTQESPPEVSTYRFSYQMPEDVIAGKSYTVPVTIQPELIGKNGYESVRFNISVSSPEGQSVQLIAKDSEGNEYNVAELGYWGPADGFPIEAEYTATTEFEIIFSGIGHYTITLSLVDLNTNAIIVSDSVETNVQSLILSLSKTTAMVGDSITVSVKTLPEAWVPIKVLDEAGNILLFDSARTDAEGNCSMEFIIPEEASGMLTVVVGEGSDVTSKAITIGPAADECFIATAAFGSKYDWPVALLRDFRDQFLLTNAMGTTFVSFYYKHSPPIAEAIASNQGLKILVRVLLAPVIAVVYLLYHPAIAIIALGLVIGAIWFRSRPRLKELV